MKIIQREWTDPEGRKQLSWGWTAMMDGKQVRRFNHSWQTQKAAKAAYEAWLAEQARQRERAATITFAEACDRYLAVKRKKSLAEDGRNLETLKAEFGAETPLSSITAGRISAYKSKRLAAKHNGHDLTAAAINRPLALLRHLLRLAHEEWEVLSTMPRIRLEKEGQGRLRWLTPAEAARLLDSCGQSRNPDLRDLVELTL